MMDCGTDWYASTPLGILLLCAFLAAGCSEESVAPDPPSQSQPQSLRISGGELELTVLDNYANQPIPPYILKDNTLDNPITDEGATLGRVLFYDKKLSVDNSISCASCHQQAFAFGDTNKLSLGVNGTTSRHSMRLVNSRFSVERKFLWNETATELEDQTARPIEDHIEMGFSGRDGGPDFDDMIRKISQERYYERLFTLAYGDPDISRERISRSLAQFIRSIQSFDSRFDAGFQQVNDIMAPFPNFTDQENLGKSIFLLPNSGSGSTGAGCQGCHFAPEFDIDPDSRNNGVVSVADRPTEVDVLVTRAPTLRDLFNPRGRLNGPLMHNGEFATIESVIDHYDSIPDDPRNTNLDVRLRDGSQTQRLFLDEEEKEAIIAFLKTLTGSSVYIDSKYADPFQ